MTTPQLEESESWEKEFYEKFSPTPEKNAVYASNGSIEEIKSFISSTLLKEREKAIKEIEIMEAEEPSNFPTPIEQEVVYSILGRLKERILNPQNYDK